MLYESLVHPFRKPVILFYIIVTKFYPPLGTGRAGAPPEKGLEAKKHVKSRKSSFQESAVYGGLNDRYV